MLILLASVLCVGLLRCGKSCRLRWINYLRPDLKRGNFTEEEDELIIKLHGLLGNKYAPRFLSFCPSIHDGCEGRESYSCLFRVCRWSLIAGRLPGRTDNEIKNYWNTHIKRKLLGRGIDPQTHRPVTSLQQHQDFLIPLPQETAAAAAKSTADSTDDGRMSSDASRHHEDLDLDLSISLPHPKHSPPSESSSPTSTATATPSTGSCTEAVCLCCHLGFQSCEACSIRTIPGPYVFRYIRPLEDGKHT
ncbi:hypothetical protein BHE74_00025469 [Ensete ventricosum]|nr:hypothetical protein GW17_00029902 [Ensete ventricosum]RWW67104.1 hypothetical protein BHE74_00025469 [Ensete ventricosum]RZS08990.1 hypothetical protein BHM03_00040036 [Ensete ventricosum]